MTALLLGVVYLLNPEKPLSNISHCKDNSYVFISHLRALAIQKNIQMQ